MNKKTGDIIWVTTTIMILVLAFAAPYMLIVPLFTGIIRFWYLPRKRRQQLELQRRLIGPTYTYNKKEGGPF